ncbi:hypothetical protein LY78DRAFT_14305 [Colletotrichum sublineola]|nr:hypothetical protein LY78DRAFT_14305 [Colletotrichum sublineola]
MRTPLRRPRLRVRINFRVREGRASACGLCSTREPFTDNSVVARFDRQHQSTRSSRKHVCAYLCHNTSQDVLSSSPVTVLLFLFHCFFLRPNGFIVLWLLPPEGHDGIPRDTDVIVSEESHQESSIEGRICACVRAGGRPGPCARGRRHRDRAQVPVAFREEEGTAAACTIGNGRMPRQGKPSVRSIISSF